MKKRGYSFGKLEPIRVLLQQLHEVRQFRTFWDNTAELLGPQPSVTGAADFLFYLAFSGLIAHELDAVHKHEWRLLFVLRALPDGSARRAFVLVHVPLFAVLLWLAAYPGAGVRYWTMLGLDLFMIVHAWLHWRLSGHARYEFNTPHSRLIIYGTAALAAAHLLVLLLTR